MIATVVYARNPFDPARDREVKQITRRRRIDKLAPQTDQPFICLLNGQPLLRANKGWHKSVKDGDVLAFVYLPQGGGGGSNPLKIVLMVAIAVAAPALAGSLAPALGLTTEASIGMLAGGIAFAGNVLVNALIPPPKPPSPQQAQAGAAASPTYSLQAQGNAARISEAIPVIYGRMTVYPDFAAAPYTEYAGNEQYLYQLLCVGQGYYDIEQIRIEDTPIENFEEIEYEIVEPGEEVTLFPVNVVTAPEVSGQELLTNSTVGPFVSVGAGAEANGLAVDMVCPKGLFYANDEGGLDKVGVTFRIEARQIDDDGAAIGSWSTLGTHSISGATGTPLRRSYRYTVAAGRYEVRATRTDTKQTSSRYGHDLVWASLRAYLPGAQSYGNVTLIAMRMRATNNLSSQSSRRINVRGTRKLPIWDGSTWSAPAATRSIAWALADACKANYGGKLPDSRIGLDELLELDPIWETRGDYFDATFDQKQTLWESLNTIARAGRAKPYRQGGMVHFTRHQQEELPVALFNMRNIVRGSLKTQYLTPSDETADAVVVEFFNEETEKPDEVTAQLPGYTADNPARVQLFGVTDRDHAWREGMYTAAANRYQRMPFTFQTEMEGFIPTFGDLIAVTHVRINRSVSGDVVAYDETTKLIALSEPVLFDSGDYYFGFRLRNGSYSGPWLATAGSDAYHAVLQEPLDFIPDTGTDRERTSFVFGSGNELIRRARVLAIRPRGSHIVEISAINEDDAVHTADTSTTPPVSPGWNLPSIITRPTVSSINVTLSGTASTPMILVEWAPAAGADHYYVESSYDGGDTWQRRADVAATNASFPAQRGTVYVRVRGVGLTVGEWVTWVGDPYAQPPADVATFLVSVQTDGTRQFDATMPGPMPPDFAGYRIRYRLGPGWTWEDMTDLTVGLVTATPFENNQLAAGQYTFAIKAVDDSGIESTNAKFILADLSDPRLAGVVYAIRAELYRWPGTKTDCHVEPESNTLSANDTNTWDTLTTWDAWTRWVLDPVSPIVYEHPVIDLGAVLPFTPLVSAIAEGSQAIEVATSDDDLTYSDWEPPNGLYLARYVKVRITVSGSFPRVYSLDIKLSGAVIQEDLNDIVTSSLMGSYRIATGDVRLPIVKNYSIITQVQVTLQNVGAGWSWELVDKDVGVGPRIRIYNSSNALADCTIDAAIRGA